jgi:hypothetical protein
LCEKVLFPRFCLQLPGAPHFRDTDDLPEWPRCREFQHVSWQLLEFVSWCISHGEKAVLDLRDFALREILSFFVVQNLFLSDQLAEYTKSFWIDLSRCIQNGQECTHCDCWSG